MTSIKNPCRGCPDRKVGCHAWCDAYLAFRKAKDEENRRKFIERELNHAYEEWRSNLYKRKVKNGITRKI